MRAGESKNPKQKDCNGVSRIDGAHTIMLVELLNIALNIENQ